MQKECGETCDFTSNLPFCWVGSLRHVRSEAKPPTSKIQNKLFGALVRRQILRGMFSEMEFFTNKFEAVHFWGEFFEARGLSQTIRDLTSQRIFDASPSRIDFTTRREKTLVFAVTPGLMFCWMWLKSMCFFVFRGGRASFGKGWGDGGRGGAPGRGE